jgi:hypothetical protein
LANGSPERLEELRERFLRAISDLGDGAEEGRPAMVSDVAEGAGLDPESAYTGSRSKSLSYGWPVTCVLKFLAYRNLEGVP